ncbi:hypothetical protein LCGC14_0709450 [marine sediment metagenome]|uniref:Uncharacterized protein n=1 Tax=marine sediment metagenome TaxID=412755 RepID=A0A0F9TN38_9ZZZZ
MGTGGPCGVVAALRGGVMTNPLMRPMRQLVRHDAKQLVIQQTVPRLWPTQDVDDDNEWVVASRTLDIWMAIRQRKQGWR